MEVQVFEHGTNEVDLGGDGRTNKCCMRGEFAFESTFPFSLLMDRICFFMMLVMVFVYC